MGGKFYEGAMMGAVSATVGFSASELVGQYLQELDQKIFNTAKAILYPESARAETFAGGMKGFDPARGVTISKEQYQEIESFYLGTKNNFNPDINLQRSFDLFGRGFKFGYLHVQPKPQPIIHFDRYDFVTSPLSHIFYEMWRGVKLAE